MVHGHTHTHDRPLEARDLEERGHDNNNKDDSNVVVVYTTLDATFTGDVGGYSTENADTTTSKNDSNVGVGPAVAATKTTDKETTTTAEAKKTTTTEEAKETTKDDKTTSKESEKSTTEDKKTTTEAEKAITTAETSKTEHSTITTATQDAQTGATRSTFVTSATQTSTGSDAAGVGLSATETASLTDSAASTSNTGAISSQSTGMSSGAKAGVAIGVILGVGVIAALIFFFIRKKRRNNGDEPVMTEKLFTAQDLPPPPPMKEMVPSRASTPPQLKVRPVTQFAPDLSNSASFNPASAAAAGGVAMGSAAIATRNLTDIPPPTPPKTAGSSSNPFTDPVNPFNTGNAPMTAQYMNSASPPGSSASNAAPALVPAEGAALGALGIVGAAAVVSHESNKEPSHEPELSRQPEPTESDVRPPNSPSPVSIDGESVSSAAMGPGSIAGGVAPAPANVHRVQMDFNPSMEDELELRAGTLIRMLHEYDDGWALCIRLDRSKQGVAPRSCLSARPVKPRPRPPAGGPPGPGPRGPPMMGPGPNGRSMSPAGRGPPSGRFYPGDVRPRSPIGPGYGGPPPPRAYPGRSMSSSQLPGQFPIPRAMSPGPRSMSPGPRSMSPGPGMRPGPRSMSPGPGPYPMPPRSMSPGPYGGMPRPAMPVNQRQRSNSAGNMSSPYIPGVQVAPRSSPLAATGPPVPAPRGNLPALPNSIPNSPSGTQISRKPIAP
ncbi:uncharacterized protein N7483_006863 [Penicillium malachiteum]|uniref:uncharacterized protein n=1 Tax=Penicillium malachiteum TaxID=1324776 RepID=UPI002548D7FB|nr:uncharacterized protein N7483_006863 [Penicillium malachiteum]KAJ5725506.1 hypothetical protein N7483_006863 [Penicillium malachiteum]